MQSKLPDINHIWIRWRNYGIQCIDQGNYIGAAGAVAEMNSLLTDEYRLEIDTDKFNQITKAMIKAECSKCSEQFKNIELKRYNLLLLTIDAIITNSKTSNVWDCPKCKHTNLTQETKIIQTALQRPFYHKVIPGPPIRIDMADRLGWHEKNQKWFFNAMEELEHQLGKYRAEWVSQEESIDVIEGGDEHAD